MKHFYFTLTLIVATATTFSQDFYIATAQKSGNWSDMSKWDYALRADNKKVTTVIIPKNITITLDQSSDVESLGDIEMEIFGTLELKSNRTLELNGNSIITIKEGGLITIDQPAKNEKKDKKNKKNEQVIIGNVVKFDGNIDGSISGPAAANSLTGAAPLGFSSNAMLPVNFVGFTATMEKDLVALTWSTTDEINNSHFEVQRSTDGSNFNTVAMVLPATENGGINQYRYNDKFAAKGSVYYRIRQVDFDGKEKFSQVKIVANNNFQAQALIYVAANKTVIVDTKSETHNTIVRIVNMNGSVVSQKGGSSSNRIMLSAYNAPAGAYIVQVLNMNGTSTSKKVLL